MDVAARILAARNFGVVKCAVLDREIVSVSDLAASAGLSGSADGLHLIDELRARAIVRRVLNRDLAYRSEILPTGIAEELAASFVELFSDRRPHYFTNGDFDREPTTTTSVTTGPSWNPMTDATFDTGVLVMADGRSGYCWVEDED